MLNAKNAIHAVTGSLFVIVLILLAVNYNPDNDYTLTIPILFGLAFVLFGINRVAFYLLEKFVKLEHQTRKNIGVVSALVIGASVLYGANNAYNHSDRNVLSAAVDITVGMKCEKDVSYNYILPDYKRTVASLAGINFWDANVIYDEDKNYRVATEAREIYEDIRRGNGSCLKYIELLKEHRK